MGAMGVVVCHRRVLRLDGLLLGDMAVAAAGEAVHH